MSKEADSQSIGFPIPFVKHGFSYSIVDNEAGSIGWLVIDSLVAGSSWGGIRILPDTTPSEARLLARIMTLKNALNGIPIGGAKLCIRANPSPPHKNKIIPTIAHNLSHLIQKRIYIIGTDMGSNDDDLKKIYNILNMEHAFNQSIHSIRVNDLPLTSICVGRGVIAAIEEAINTQGGEIHECTAAIQGFGNMGSGVAKMLDKKGASLIAASNRFHTIFNPHGLDVDELIQLKQKHGDFCLKVYAEKHKDTTKLSADKIFTVNSDILIPGARPLAINHENVEKIKAKFIIPFANAALHSRAYEILYRRNHIVVPDIVASAGALIASPLVMINIPIKEIFHTVDSMIRFNVRRVLMMSDALKLNPFQVALALAKNFIRKLTLWGPAYLLSSENPWIKIGKAAYLSRFLRLLPQKLTQIR